MLTQIGLAEKTDVLYTSDHGDSPGARSLWGQVQFLSESAKVPMILSGPDVPDGVVCETPVSLVDCHATILAELGAEHGLRTTPRQKAAHSSRLPIQTMHPTDRSSVNITPSPRRRAAACVKANTSITTTSYRPELFDLKADPEELHDLAGAAYKPVLAEIGRSLRERLDPEAVDAEARAAQAAAFIERHGGPDKAKRRRSRHDTGAGLWWGISLFSVRCLARSLPAG